MLSRCGFGGCCEGVACCVKHFPGHGDTQVDSHLDLPTVDKPRAALWSKLYDGPASGSDYPSAAAVTSDGSAVFVTGGSEGSSTSSDYATVAYNSSG